MIPENVEQFITEYGLRERVDPLCVRHGDNPADGVCTCEAADAPADTALRDQIARELRGYMSARFGDGWHQWSLDVADALLPLLRAHDAQVAAQARRDALNEAAAAWEMQLSTDGLLVNSAQWLRDRADSPQPARDQEQFAPQAWAFGPQAAARLVAATSWPWERKENRDEWAIRLVHEPDMLAREAASARARLESAIAYLASPQPARDQAHDETRQG